MVLAVAFLMLWAALDVAGHTKIGRIMHQAMVELPASAANRVKRAHVAMSITIVACVTIGCAAGDNSPARILGALAPDLALWLTGLEISALLEVAAIATAALTSIRRIGLLSFFDRPFVRAVRLSGGARRARRSKARPPLSAGNDDEDSLGFAAAA